MILLMTEKGLTNLMMGLFIASGILLVIAAVLNEEACAKKYGMPTWKDWWNYFKKH